MMFAYFSNIMSFLSLRGESYKGIRRFYRLPICRTAVVEYEDPSKTLVVGNVLEPHVSVTSDPMSLVGCNDVTIAIKLSTDSKVVFVPIYDSEGFLFVSFSTFNVEREKRTVLRVKDFAPAIEFAITIIPNENPCEILELGLVGRI